MAAAHSTLVWKNSFRLTNPKEGSDREALQIARLLPRLLSLPLAFAAAAATAVAFSTAGETYELADLFPSEQQPSLSAGGWTFTDFALTFESLTLSREQLTLSAATLHALGVAPNGEALLKLRLTSMLAGDT